MIKISLKIILIVSIAGSIISSIFIGIFINPNVSWKYNITNNLLESQSSGISISSNGEYIVAGSGNDKLYLFKTSNSTPLWIFRASNDIPCVAISSDSNFIITGGEDGVAYIFNKSSSIPIWNYTTGDQLISSVAISSDGNYSLFCTSHNLYLFQRSNDSILIKRPISGDKGVISSDGYYFSSIDRASGIIYFFSKLNSTPIWQYSTGDFLSDISMTPDGESVVTGGQTKEVFLFNKSSSIPIVFDVEQTVRSVAISQDGKHFALGCSDGISLFDTTTLTRKWKYDLPIYSTNYVIAMSSDGRYIVADNWRDSLHGEEIHRLLIFKQSSSNPIFTIETDSSRVNEIELSSDGNHISVITQRMAYYINLAHPFIDENNEIKLSISYVSLASFLIFGIIGSFFYRYTKVHLEREEQEKEFLEVIDTLDKKYEGWDKKEEKDKV